MMENKINQSKVIEILSIIYNLELNGVVRYTHYSLMIFGYRRLVNLKKKYESCLHYTDSKWRIVKIIKKRSNLSNFKG